MTREQSAALYRVFIELGQVWALVCELDPVAGEKCLQMRAALCEQFPDVIRDGAAAHMRTAHLCV